MQGISGFIALPDKNESPDRGAAGTFEGSINKELYLLRSDGT